VPIRCLIVDDNESFLEAARVLLEREGMRVVGVATTSAEALSQVEALRPDVVLADIFLGDESGLELARQLVAERLGDMAVILISTHSEADVAGLMDGSAAAGFLPKAELSAEAIRRVVDGRAA
jgi:DNA-binding NarL/FixJ family response regulator